MGDLQKGSNTPETQVHLARRIQAQLAPQFDAAAKRDAALAWLDAINALRRALGADEQPVAELRMDNYGLLADGRLVAVDYDLYGAPGEAVEWVLRESKAGPVWMNRATRRRFERARRSAPRGTQRQPASSRSPA